MSLEVKEKRQVRLVFLGAAGVGKKALIRRFLQDNFSPNDELISLYRSWTLHKLSIHNSDAFSLEDVKTLRNEILEIQEDKYTPNVVVGNKVDREEERHVSNKDVWSTVEMDWNKGYLEALAKENISTNPTNINVVEVFKELLQRENLPSQLSPAIRTRRETFRKDTNNRPPIHKPNSCIVS
uniref:Uncharacterized protein n=1 Tax=Mola mola TaxID=94237 RepID=A0A3Q3W574_MOLML